MDGRHFDALARRINSRRTAIGGLFAGLLLLPIEAAARGKKGKQRKRRSKARKRAAAQGEPCWRAGACIVKKGANISRCDLAGYTAPEALDCTRCNLSRSNLRGANLQGANFTRANLSGACLIDADFTGAIFANTTNLANAIFCHTTMPDGSTNDSGCASSTACCSTCTASTTWVNQTSFGSSGSGVTELNTPRGVAVAGDQLTVWVADGGNSRISVWTRPNASSTPWTNQTTFGSFGSGGSEFAGPFGIAVASDGLTAWVADAGNSRVSVWTRPNASSTAWANQTTFGSFGSDANQLSAPASVAVANDRLTAWVADTFNHRISVWTRPNTNSTAWTNQTTFGSEGSGVDQFSTPRGVAVAGDQLTVWVADGGNSRISVWTRPNASSTAWTNQTTFGSFGSGTTQFSFPRGVAVAGDQLTAWVGDTGNSRVSVWTRPNASSTAWANQTTIGSFGSGVDQLADPIGVSVASDQLTMWVADASNSRVSVWVVACPT